MSTLMKNGTVLTSVEQYQADIFIEDGKISVIGKNLDKQADGTIDASGMYIVPGGVDNHSHFALPFGGTIARDYNTSNAAIIGGTTTVVDFVPQPPGMSLKDSIAKHDDEQAKGVAMTDYALHAVVNDATDTLFEEIEKLPEIGIPTIKLFMAYKGTPYYMDDSIIFKALQSAKKAGVTMMVHAENAHVIDELQKQCVANRQLEPKYHAESRPPVAESECTTRAIALAEIAGAPLFVVHVSCIEAMQAVRDSYARGLPVYGETCPHYLVLTVENLSKPDFEGAKYVCSPPLRPSEHLEALWVAIQKGWLQVVGSDHCGFDWKTQKHMGRDDFTKIPNGLPSVQFRLSVLWTYGVEKGKLSPQRLVDVFSTAPAKVNGIFPRKGTIAVGSDADLVLFDPNWSGVMSVKDSLEGVDFTPYEGLEQKGRVEKVLLRGRLTVDKGRFAGSKGQGQFIPGDPFGMCYEGL
jgi:dihydropyrimidinase